MVRVRYRLRAGAVYLTLSAFSACALSAGTGAVGQKPLEKSSAGAAPVTTTQAIRRYPLGDEALGIARTAGGREVVRYLVNCALPEDVVGFVELDSGSYEFPGGIGLAPDWIRRPLTEEEQRWVSACALARTNYFGVEVLISMRNTMTTFAALQTTPQEQREYSIYEGDFFGNLFSDPPVAGVSVGRRSQAEQGDSVLQRRVCTEHDPEGRTIGGKSVSRCGFIITGYADEPDAHTIAGQRFDAYISVYLKPDELLKSE